jgi:hypothetical protein
MILEHPRWDPGRLASLASSHCGRRVRTSTNNVVAILERSNRVCEIDLACNTISALTFLELTSLDLG